MQREAAHLGVARKQTNTELKGPGKSLLKQKLEGSLESLLDGVLQGKHVKERFIKVGMGVKG